MHSRKNFFSLSYCISASFIIGSLGFSALHALDPDEFQKETKPSALAASGTQPEETALSRVKKSLEKKSDEDIFELLFSARTALESDETKTLVKAVITSGKSSPFLSYTVLNLFSRSRSNIIEEKSRYMLMSQTPYFGIIPEELALQFSRLASSQISEAVRNTLLEKVSLFKGHLPLSTTLRVLMSKLGDTDFAKAMLQAALTSEHSEEEPDAMSETRGSDLYRLLEENLRLGCSETAIAILDVMGERFKVGPSPSDLAKLGSIPLVNFLQTKFPDAYRDKFGTNQLEFLPTIITATQRGKQ